MRATLFDSILMVRCTYLLPFRRTQFSQGQMEELRAYLQSIQRADCQALVIDGSPPAIFDLNARAICGSASHHKVDRRFGYKNDKVNGIHRGVELAATDKIILADDDVRYTPAEIEQVAAALDQCSVVRPQNYFLSLPWWAKMEAARMLINRATLYTADYPGTCAFHRETMHRVGPYDGDVLFDNEEIIRHFAACGADVRYANDLFIGKQAPTFRKWLEQRTRQAYEDFGLRFKTGLFFALAPLLCLIGFSWGARAVAFALGGIAVASIALAILGRARGIAAKYFPLRVCFFAPLWVLERTASTYCALYFYLTRGGYPFGNRLLTRGIGRSWKRGGKVASRQLAAAHRLDTPVS
jgi:Glycosyl transferase family 21